jgi:hypothetical protein
MRAYLGQYPDGRFAALGRISERRLCKVGPEVVVSSVAPPAPAAVKDPPPFLPAGSTPADAHQPVTPPPALVAAPPAAVPPAGPNMTIATAPADVPASAAPVARPAVVPDIMDIGRRLQKELVRVGCAVNGMETDGSWGSASRDALRAFNERTHAAAAIDRATPEALEAVQSRKERVCPLTCEPGAELRDGHCVEVHREPSRHHASRPPQRERPDRQRAPHDERSPQFHAPAIRDCVHVTFPQCSPR